jgi:hypothetical protein
MKNHIPSVLFGLLLCARLNAAVPAAPAASFTPAVSPQVVVEGRYAATPQSSVRLGFCGTVLHLRFRGEALAMRVKATSDEVYFDVRVDQGEPTRLRVLTGEADYPLLHEAATAEHVLEITRQRSPDAGRP